MKGAPRVQSTISLPIPSGPKTKHIACISKYGREIRFLLNFWLIFWSIFLSIFGQPLVNFWSILWSISGEEFLVYLGQFLVNFWSTLSQFLVNFGSISFRGRSKIGLEIGFKMNFLSKCLKTAR